MLKILSINSRRYRLREKIQRVYEFINDQEPDVVLIQEASVAGYKQVVKDNYHVFMNVSSQARDGVGVVTLVKKNIKVYDIMMDEEGRVLRVRVNDCQIWNVYPNAGIDRAGREDLF